MKSHIPAPSGQRPVTPLSVPIRCPFSFLFPLSHQIRRTTHGESAREKRGDNLKLELDFLVCRLGYRSCVKSIRLSGQMKKERMVSCSNHQTEFSMLFLSLFCPLFPAFITQKYSESSLWNLICINEIDFVLFAFTHTPVRFIFGNRNRNYKNSHEMWWMVTVGWRSSGRFFRHSLQLTVYSLLRRYFMWNHSQRLISNEMELERVVLLVVTNAYSRARAHGWMFVFQLNFRNGIKKTLGNNLLFLDKIGHFSFCVEIFFEATNCDCTIDSNVSATSPSKSTNSCLKWNVLAANNNNNFNNCRISWYGSAK